MLAIIKEEKKREEVFQDEDAHTQTRRLSRTGSGDDESFEKDRGETDTGNQKCRDLPYQSRVRTFYNSMGVQLAVAFLIIANFATSAVESQELPEYDTDEYWAFQYCDRSFTFLFAIELAINMYGHFFCDFWKNPWNWFDFIIVWTSMLEVLPGANVMRLFRAFRVVRLFKRIDSLKNIIDGVLLSVPDVANAFLILMLLMGVWSIMGVSFFSCKNYDSMCDVYDYQGSDAQNFNTFADAMFTLWAVLTGERWVDIAIPLLYVDKVDDNRDLGQTRFFALIYFVSFYFMASVIMMNVVVAILLENYLEATHNLKNDKRLEDPDHILANVEDEIEECQMSINRLQNALTNMQPDSYELEPKFQMRLSQKRQYFKLLKNKFIDAVTAVVIKDVGDTDITSFELGNLETNSGETESPKTKTTSQGLGDVEDSDNESSNYFTWWNA